MIQEPEESGTSVIDLSILIASRNASETIQQCLQSLDDQQTDHAYEVIIVDSSVDQTPEIIKKFYPHFTLLEFSERKYCGDARNIGISRAKGNLIAFIDADCTVSTNWIDNVILAHREPYLAIGGAIANGNKDDYVGWAAYFTEFSKWMPTENSCFFEDVAGASMTYKKQVFQRFGYLIEGTYGSDTEFHWRMAGAGEKIRFNPSLVVYHHNISNLKSFLSHEFIHGRYFGRVRARHKSFSTFRKYAYAILFPLIIGKLSFKLVQNNISNPVYLRHFIRCLPIVLLGPVSWTFGEIAGYLSRD